MYTQCLHNVKWRLEQEMEGVTPLNINHQVTFYAHVNEILKSRLSASGLEIRLFVDARLLGICNLIKNVFKLWNYQKKTARFGSYDIPLR